MSSGSQIQEYLESIADTKAKALLQTLSSLIVDSQQRITGLSIKTNELTSQLELLNSSMDIANAVLSDLSTRITAIETQNSSLVIEIDAIKTRLTALETPTP